MSIKKTIPIKIDTATRMVYFDDNFVGLNGENLQTKIVFSFKGDFVDGTPTLHIDLNGTKYVISELTKVGETYEFQVKSSILTTQYIMMQLVITEGTGETNIPVFKSKEFGIYVANSINAVETIPEQYETWMNLANTKLNQMDNFNASVTKSGDTATISITNRLGETTTANITDGKDAKINGVNTITINEGNNVQINQVGSSMTISATDTTYTAGTGIAINNNVISNTKASVEYVNITETSGTLDANTYAILSDTTKNVVVVYEYNHLTRIQVKSGYVRYAMTRNVNTNQNKTITFICYNNTYSYSIVDKTEYVFQTTGTGLTFANNQLDLVPASIDLSACDNTTSGFITSSYHDNTKQDTLVSGTNIKTINNQSILGSGNIEIQGGGSVDYFEIVNGKLNIIYEMEENIND